MRLLREFDQKDLAATGRELFGFAEELFPICRSITGDGIRQTLACIQKRIPLQLSEVPSARPSSIGMSRKNGIFATRTSACRRGERVIDFAKCNLHLVNYSKPVRATMTLSELKAHLFTIPEKPDWIPYRKLRTTTLSGDFAFRTISSWR